VAVLGGNKRCGGQGDVLAGILGTFINYENNLIGIKEEGTGY
jgi:NAD(P)H-hydrate repair Nnr-like enzyme with NAD(P)H-hydrate dehydratase domain